VVESAGRVVQVNLSPGGVPKTAVPEARVGRLGLDGDDHHDDTVHGGPLRAVCLFAVEAIERLRAEGHPIEPGAVGENITTEGFELADLQVGARLAIGDEVLLELTSPALPCDTIAAAFRDRKPGRISALGHPHDSRIYARVLREGVVRRDDPIRVRSADPESDVATQVALFRIESAVRNRHVELWRAAQAAGYAVDVVDDGELAIATSADLPEQPFSLAFGLRSLPQFLPVVLETFATAGSAGWFAFPGPPWRGAEPAEHVVTFSAAIDAVDTGFELDGLEVREAGPSDPDAWTVGPRGRSSDGAALAAAWPAILRGLASRRAMHRFNAVEGGEVVASAMLFTHRRIGLLTSASVVPDRRGRGIQRALIAARARRAAELGCDLLVVETARDNAASIRNAERAGFRELAWREIFRFDPATADERAIDEARERFGQWAAAARRPVGTGA